jgi:hypothetical protein
MLKEALYVDAMYGPMAEPLHDPTHVIQLDADTRLLIRDDGYLVVNTSMVSIHVEEPVIEPVDLLLATCDKDLVWHAERMDPRDALYRLDGASDGAVGVRYGNGHVTVCDSVCSFFKSTDDWLAKLKRDSELKAEKYGSAVERE